MACAAVSARHGDSSSVTEAFDFGPPFGPRAQVGQSIPHLPPFGAVYVAWDPHDAEQWIERASLSEGERSRYLRALAEVRERGFSVTIASSRRPELAAAISTLAVQPGERHARQARDEVMSALAHSEYLAADLDADATLRVSHLAAPVFDRQGRAVASILLLGPEYEISATELRARGDALGARRSARHRAGRRAEPSDSRARLTQRMGTDPRHPASRSTGLPTSTTRFGPGTRACCSRISSVSSLPGRVFSRSVRARGRRHET